MAWQRTASPRARAHTLAALAAIVAALVPALVFAHERWVKQVFLPIDKAYFQNMTGEVLRLSLMATIAVAGVVAAWYVIAVPLADRLTPRGPEELAREAKLPRWKRLGRLGLRFALDADVDTRWMERGERIAAWVFWRIPAFVLVCGAIEGWIVMPSYPAHGTIGNALRWTQLGLAAWALTGKRPRELGAIVFLVFFWQIAEYGIVAIDAIPVLASGFFWFFARDPKVVNARQIAGMRLSLGIGFFLLGLINKTYIAEEFIAVGDAFPQLLAGPRQLFPDLTRETWSFATALGEMVFGLLLLLGLFDKLATLALSLIFANFVLVFGWAEIVHLYPICGFMVLFFHAPPGTVLDGAVFRAHVKLWHATGHSASPALFPVAVGLVAVLTAALLMFLPLFLIIHVAPRL